MLVLTRKPDQSIMVGNEIEITVLEVRGEQVRLGIGSDSRIGSHFLYAGCGWGGSCFPKDVKALAHMGALAGLDMPLLAATRSVNQRQRGLLVGRLRQRYGNDLHGHRFAVWGLAFKPGTDDLRDAPSLDIIDALLACGASVAAYDPVALANARQHWAGQDGLLLLDDPLAVTDGASALLVLTEWREFRSPDFAAVRRRMRHPLVLDGRNLYAPGLLAEQGFEHQGIGRGSVNPPGWLVGLNPLLRQALAA